MFTFDSNWQRQYIKMSETELKEIKISPEDEARKNQKLTYAFRRKYKTINPNYFIPNENKTVFEKILRTPKTAKDIKWCIKNGADLYTVSFAP